MGVFMKGMEFGVDDALIYQPEIYDRMNDFDGDVAFYKSLALEAQGSILELCCGTGRLTIPLAKAGFDVTGLDFTLSMLDCARKKNEENGLDIEFVQGDMRKFSLDKTFDFIFIPFNSIQNTYSMDDIVSIFNCIKRHLSPNGLFAFDIFNPNLDYLVRKPDEKYEAKNFRTESGEEFSLVQTMSYDRAKQVNKVRWHINIGGETKVEELDMRVFYPQEMDAILTLNGFEIISKFGDFERGEFNSESPKQIYVCRLNEIIKHRF